MSWSPFLLWVFLPSFIDFSPSKLNPHVWCESFLPHPLCWRLFENLRLLADGLLMRKMASGGVIDKTLIFFLPSHLCLPVYWFICDHVKAYCSEQRLYWHRQIASSPQRLCKTVLTYLNQSLYVSADLLSNLTFLHIPEATSKTAQCSKSSFNSYIA